MLFRHGQASNDELPNTNEYLESKILNFKRLGITIEL